MFMHVILSRVGWSGPKLFSLRHLYLSSGLQTPPLSINLQLLPHSLPSMEKQSSLSLRQRFSNRSRASTASNESHSLEAPNERFRLIPLSPRPDTSSSTILRDKASRNDGEEQKVDIVAVHGLGGDPYKTWTHENGTLWLRDIAGRQLPGARIYSFGYDSAFAFSQGTGNVRDFARSLLEAIKLERMSHAVCILK
jgi:hypothetical protein